MGEWTNTTLGEIADGPQGFVDGPFGSNLPASDYVEHGIPVIRGTNLSLGVTRFSAKDFAFVSLETAERLSRSEVLPGDIVFTKKGTIGQTGIVPEDSPYERYILSSNQMRLRVDKSRANPLFVYYYVSQKESVDKVIRDSTITGVPKTNLTYFREFPVRLPVRQEQDAIVSIIGALDDKIELNRQTNETLEALARAIFKDWFVDFGPTRAKAEGGEPYLAPDLWDLFPDALDDDDKPEGWETRSVYEFANVVYGAPFSSKQFNTQQLGLPLIRIRDLATHEPGVCTEQKHPKGHIIEPGDIVVGMDGEFRLHIWKGPRSWLNQRVCHFEPLSSAPTSFLAEALKEPLACFERGKVGTTVIHLGKSDIDTFELIHPGEEILLAFSELVEPLLRRTVESSLESRTLAQTRDLLLPRLMSGEIRLRDAEKLVEAVA